MKVAFKEWAVVVDALGRGEQILVLRKGGIREGPQGFHVDHPDFLLFPTLFHQQRESVLPAAQERFDALARGFPGPDQVRIEFSAHVAAWQRIDSIRAARQLKGLHLWRDEVIEQRYHWGREANIYALALRVFRLPQALELPMLREYGGCKSWIELAANVETSGATPVLEDDAFARHLEALRQRWQDRTDDRAVARDVAPG